MTRAELLEQLAQAESRQRSLMDEAVELAARLPDIRDAFGNPFTYSHPDNDDEGQANFTGHSSHAVVLPTVLELRPVEQRIRQLMADIDALDSKD